MTSLWTKLFGGCTTDNVTRVHNLPPPLSPQSVRRTSRRSSERKIAPEIAVPGMVKDKRMKSLKRFSSARVMSAASAPFVPYSFSGQDVDSKEEKKPLKIEIEHPPETLIKNKILDLLKMHSPPEWKCEPELQVCLPVSNSDGLVGHSFREVETWDTCQSKCGRNYEKAKKVFIDSQQRLFLTTLLNHLVSIIFSNSPLSPLSSLTSLSPTTPLGPVSPTEEISAAATTKTGSSTSSGSSASSGSTLEKRIKLPNTTKDIAMAIRIIFALASIPTEKMPTSEIDDILASVVELHWLPLYEIILFFGVNKQKIFYTLGEHIEQQLPDLTLKIVELIENLQVNTLNYKTIDNMKKLKILLHRYLIAHLKFIDVAKSLEHEDEGIIFLVPSPLGTSYLTHREITRNMYKPHKLKIYEIVAELKKLCRALVAHASEILGEQSGGEYGGETTALDAFILYDEERTTHSFLDTTALDIAVTIKKIAKEIEDLVIAFFTKIREHDF